jgi:rhodanese-related sulfurtransferase
VRPRARGLVLAALWAGAVTAAWTVPEGPRPASAIHTGADVPLAIAPEDLQRYREAGEQVTVVDLRPPGAFQAGHVTGARSLPIADLRRRLGEIPRTGRVALYAATPEEALAAYRALRDAGHRNVMLLAGGLAEWSRLRLPVAQGPR